MILRRATLRLTLLHSLTMVLVVAVFAIAVNAYISAAFDLEIPENTEAAAQHAMSTLRMGLVVGCAVLVVLIPPTSYLLARRALAPVRENLESQRRFVDDASHELRTPIAAARGELELALLRPRSAGEYRDAIAGALSDLGGLASLTDDLLLLSRAERDSAASERVDVVAVATEVIDRSPGKERISLLASGRVPVLGSEPLLGRALANLVENAVKYSPPGSPITVMVTAEHGRVSIQVRDSGEGMSSSELRHAFDRFWRADTTRSTPGHGIGLAVVRRIARLHGGRAELRSDPGEGTVASLDVPGVAADIDSVIVPSRSAP